MCIIHESKYVPWQSKRLGIVFPTVPPYILWFTTYFQFHFVFFHVYILGKVEVLRIWFNFVVTCILTFWFFGSFKHLLQFKTPDTNSIVVSVPISLLRNTSSVWNFIPCIDPFVFFLFLSIKEGEWKEKREVRKEGK